VIGDVFVTGIRARSSSLRLVTLLRFEVIADRWLVEWFVVGRRDENGTS
jgi:hypothetical protein